METESLFDGKYESTFVEVNGLKLHYTDWNPTAGHTILMVHGLNVQCHTWDPIADLLDDEYRIVCIDLRGHGDSDWAKDGYWVQSFVSDIYEFGQKLGIMPFSYLGHSVGARIGIAFGGEHPEALRHLMLSDTGPEVPRTAALFARDTVGSTSEVRGFSNEEKALAHFRQMHPEWQPVFVDLHVKYQLRRNWAGKLVFKSDPDMFWITGSAGAKEVPYLWEMASRVSAPTLIMSGKRSPFFNEELIERMLKVMPRAEVERFDTGHYIPREDPESFCQAVREFLRK